MSIMGISVITHPLSLNTYVEAMKPTCACAGGKFTRVSGKITKVIPNHSGTWYYLDSGVTIKADWVESATI